MADLRWFRHHAQNLDPLLLHSVRDVRLATLFFPRQSLKPLWRSAWFMIFLRELLDYYDPQWSLMVMIDRWMHWVCWKSTLRTYAYLMSDFRQKLLKLWPWWRWLLTMMVDRNRRPSHQRRRATSYPWDYSSLCSCAIFSARHGSGCSQSINQCLQIFLRAIRVT